MYSRSLLLPLLLSLSGTVFGEIIDDFKGPDSNARGNWHGCDEAPGISCSYSPGGLTILSSDTDLSFYTQFDNGGCQDVSGWESQYIHIAFSGSADFTVALQQNNDACDPNIAPYPQTWDVVYARDYVSGNAIYIPISHFNINKAKTIGLAFKAFRDPGTATTFSLVETLTGLPDGVTVPPKKTTGPLYFSCTRPNSIAFGIDDGQPEYAAEVMKIIDEENIKVTFFTVANALEAGGVFKDIYTAAAAKGHQIALHSYSHPKIESLPSIAEIDEQLVKSHEITKSVLGVDSHYFRAPYGTDGALTRQRLEVSNPGAKTIAWSIDIQDWIYLDNDPEKKQTEAVKNDLAKGGNLFVTHYLYRSTVDQFRDFIKLAKGTGKQIMRVDQCLEDPSAPALTKRSVHGMRD